MAPPVPPEVFRTGRLLLRRPTGEDAQALFARWAQDEAVTRFLVWRPHRSLEESRRHIDGCEARWADGSAFIWFLEAPESGQLVGSLAARPGAHGVSLGYLLARDVWGQGLMVEALHPVVDWWLHDGGAYRVWATCDLQNHGSARVLEKAGFAHEGVLRRWDIHPALGSEPRDAHCYARVRPVEPDVAGPAGS